MGSPRRPARAGRLARGLNHLAVALVVAARRLDPYYRDAFDRRLRDPLAAAVQALAALGLRDEHLALAEERELPGEPELIAGITATMAAFLHDHYPPGSHWERAGNTKTYGVVRGELTVLPDLPDHLRHGLLAAPRTYRAWVRFAGPGPLAPPDLQDNGILSIGVKVMGVEGPKLLGDERLTQDLTGISCPTFTTPDVRANLDLQRHIGAGTPLFYLAKHPLDAAMQGLYARLNTSPLEVAYWSCTPCLLGEGQAIRYTFRPSSDRRTRIPRPIPDDWLRQSLAAGLATMDASFDLLVQVQTDARRMPVEHAGVAWPERLSPSMPVARLHLPAQRFDSPAQLAFADVLSYNPWHSLPEHRPLGNQNRGRRAIYEELSRLRQRENGVRHVEPTGDEVFD